MATLTVVQVNGPTLEVDYRDGSRLGQVLSDANVQAEGKALVLDGSVANETTRLEGDSELIIAGTSKGGSK